MTEEQREWIQRLYLRMPGAKQPPVGRDGYMWGEVDGSDEWSFCEEIVLSVTAFVKSQDAYRGVG